MVMSRHVGAGHLNLGPLEEHIGLLAIEPSSLQSHTHMLAYMHAYTHIYIYTYMCARTHIYMIYIA